MNPLRALCVDLNCIKQRMCQKMTENGNTRKKVLISSIRQEIRRLQAAHTVVRGFHIRLRDPIQPVVRGVCLRLFGVLGTVG